MIDRIAKTATVAGALASAAVFVSGPAAAQEVPVYEPSSPWHLNYADDSCRIARTFGEGDDKTILMMDRFGPGDRFDLIIAGLAIEHMGVRKTDRGFKMQFGPVEPLQEMNPYLGALEGYGDALFDNASLTPTPEDFAFENGDPAQLSYSISAEREAATEWIGIRSKRSPGFKLATGPMGEILNAMRQCTAELMTHWGIDVVRHETLSRAAYPKNDPGDWITTSDYPSSAVRRNHQGAIAFRLSVDAEGKPTQCHIQGASEPAEFNDLVCSLLRKRARFDPALDANGEAMPSFFRGKVMFLLPD